MWDILQGNGLSFCSTGRGEGGLLLLRRYPNVCVDLVQILTTVKTKTFLYSKKKVLYYKLGIRCYQQNMVNTAGCDNGTVVM